MEAELTAIPITEAPPRGRGRPPRTTAQRAEQRGRLIDGIIGGIRRYGAEASIDDLAEAAGVSKPVLYDEFGDKLGIADAVAVVLAERLEARVLADLATGPGFDVEGVVEAVVVALVNLIDAEPAVYGFIVRSIRSNDRGLLDNALVRVLHDRATLFIGLVTPGLSSAYLRILTDSLFGFVFAAVESWQKSKRPRKAEVARMLTYVVRGGLQAVAENLAVR